MRPGQRVHLVMGVEGWPMAWGSTYSRGEMDPLGGRWIGCPTDGSHPNLIKEGGTLGVQGGRNSRVPESLRNVLL